MLELLFHVFVSFSVFSEGTKPELSNTDIVTEKTLGINPQILEMAKRVEKIDRMRIHYHRKKGEWK